MYDKRREMKGAKAIAVKRGEYWYSGIEYPADRKAFDTDNPFTCRKVAMRQAEWWLAELRDNIPFWKIGESLG